MKVKLNKNQLSRIDNIEKYSDVCNFLKNKDKLRFNVGDILIRKRMHWSYDSQKESWEIETTSDTNALPRRYVYIYENPDGVGFVSRLKISDGELGEEVICLADINTEEDRFEVDPLFLDSVLLGDGSFDIKALKKAEKDRKNDVYAFNKKASSHFTKLSEVNNWLKTFNVGDTFTRAYDNDRFLGVHLEQYKIKSIKEKYINRLSADDKENYTVCADQDYEFDGKKVIEITDTDDNRYFSFELLGETLYRNPPMSIHGDK